MKEVGSPKLLLENLDLTPIHPILWTDLHEEGPGRPIEYNPEWDLGPDAQIASSDTLHEGPRETPQEGTLS